MIRPDMAVEIVDGKRVIVVRIPEASPIDKPVFIRNKGLPKGACRRIGSTDQICSDDDIAKLYGLRDERSFDKAPLTEEASIDDLSSEAIKEYRQTRAELNASADELRLDDDELLLAVGAAAQTKRGYEITRAGLILFGKPVALRRLYPSLRIDYIIVPGSEWAANPTERYESVEIRQPLLIAVPRAVALVSQDLPKSFQLKGRTISQNRNSSDTLRGHPRSYRECSDAPELPHDGANSDH